MRNKCPDTLVNYNFNNCRRYNKHDRKQFSSIIYNFKLSQNFICRYLIFFCFFTILVLILTKTESEKTHSFISENKRWQFQFCETFSKTLSHVYFSFSFFLLLHVLRSLSFMTTISTNNKSSRKLDVYILFFFVEMSPLEYFHTHASIISSLFNIHNKDKNNKLYCL